MKVLQCLLLTQSGHSVLLNRQYRIDFVKLYTAKASKPITVPIACRSVLKAADASKTSGQPQASQATKNSPASPGMPGKGITAKAPR
jgi:hypothetical protein